LALADLITTLARTSEGAFMATKKKAAKKGGKTKAKKTTRKKGAK
jgi:hypothetical protein